MKRKKQNKETFDNAILLTRFPLIFNLNILLFLLIKKNRGLGFLKIFQPVHHLSELLSLGL